MAGWVRKLRVAFVAGLTLLGAGVSPSPAATSAPAAGAIGVFEMPALVALQGLAIQQLRAGRIDAAQSVLNEAAPRQFLLQTLSLPPNVQRLFPGVGVPDLCRIPGAGSAI